MIQNSDQFSRVGIGRAPSGGVGLALGSLPFERPVSIDELRERVPSGSSTFERHHVSRMIGRGGQGAVYEAWDETLGRTVAMKVAPDVLPYVDPSTGDSGPASPALARFLEEAQITGQLDHPGIVPIHELGVDEEGQLFFTMQLVKGEDLHDIISKVHAGDEGWTRVRVLGLLLRACESLAYAHSKGVVHRDIKPSNLMVGRFGEVYVVDWGLARVVDQPDPHDLRLRDDDIDDEPADGLTTIDGRLIGTPCYMSPEQARGELDDVGVASDVYSMGTVLYELLTGRVPYVHKNPAPPARVLLDRVQAGPPASVERLRKDVPPQLVAIQERAMARDIEGRYPDMLSLANDLRAYLEGRVVAAHATGPWPELKAWIRRNRGWAMTLAASVLLTVAVVGAGVLAIDFRARGTEEARGRVRQSWIAALADPTDRGKPTPEMRSQRLEARSEIWKLIESGEATFEEQRALARQLFRFGLDRVGLIDRKQANGIVQRANYGTIPAAEGGVVECVFRYELDGRAEPPLTLVFPLDRVDEAPKRPFGEIDVGVHHITGDVTLRFGLADGNAPDAGSTSVAEYLVGGRAVTLPLPDKYLTVVEELPDEYPMRLYDDAYAQRFDERFAVRDATLLKSTSGDRRLYLELSLPRPPIPLSCEVTLEVNGVPIDARGALLAGPHPPNKLSFAGTIASSRLGRGDSTKTRVIFAVADIEGFEARAGDRLTVRVRSSRRVARTSAGMHYFLGADAECEIGIDSFDGDFREYLRRRSSH